MFRIGDRVIAKESYPSATRVDIKDYTGKVVKIVEDEFLIEFTKDIIGHNGSGNGKMGHCWWFLNDEAYCFKLIYRGKNGI